MTAACAAAASPWPSTSRPRPPIWPGSSTKPAPTWPSPAAIPGARSMTWRRRSPGAASRSTPFTAPTPPPSTSTCCARSTPGPTSSSTTAPSWSRACTKSAATSSRAFGAGVVVVEIAPIKALEAVAEGFEVMSLAEAAPVGDLFITATGSIQVLRREHFERMKDGALIANAGNFAHEIDLAALDELAGEGREVRRHITEYTLRDGRRLHLLAHGALVNIAAADGHPIEVMDMSFSVQALSLHFLARHADKLKPGVHPLPEEIDTAIARARLELLGVKLEKPTPEQEAYRQSWR